MINRMINMNPPPTQQTPPDRPESRNKEMVLAPSEGNTAENNPGQTTQEEEEVKAGLQNKTQDETQMSKNQNQLFGIVFCHKPTIHCQRERIII